jgi:pectate lyase
LRDAISLPNRIVVFDTSGVINISSQLVFSNNITLAGQTAPGDGISVYGKGVSLSYRSNVIVRNIRFHQGANSPDGQKTLNVTNGNTMIFDNVSVEWGRWDNIDMTQENGGTTNTITFQNCIIGEPIDPQHFGSLIEGADNITLSHNLFIDNNSRNPKVKGIVQYINNVVYNWGGTGLVGDHSAANHYLDCIGNYFIADPSSNNQLAGQFTATDNVYQSGNLKDLNKNDVLDGSDVIMSDFHDSNGDPTFSATKFFQSDRAGDHRQCTCGLQQSRRHGRRFTRARSGRY